MNNRRRGWFKNKQNQIDLLTNLVAYWKFDGGGINLIESINSLAPTGAPGVGTAAVGVIGTAAVAGTGANTVFYPDQDYFSFTSGGGNDLPFSFSLWVYITTFNSGFNFLLSKRSASNGQAEYQVLITPSGKILVYIFDRNNHTHFLAVESSLILVTGQFYHLAITYDASKSITGFKIYINNVQQTLTNISNGSYTGMPNGSRPLHLFNSGTGVAANLTHIGRIDELAIYKNRQLNSTEVDALYNSGVGIQYPF